MTTRTRKAPTGAKHDRCIGHVEHAYPKSGMLCIGREIGQPGMVAFADEMAASAAAHRAAFLARPVPKSSTKARKAVRPFRPLVSTLNDGLVDHRCDATAPDYRIRAGALTHTQAAGSRGFRYGLCASCAWEAPTRPWIDGAAGERGSLLIGPYLAETETRPTLPPEAVQPMNVRPITLAELVARFRAMRGLPAVETPAPVRAPVERIGRAPRRKAQPIERPAPVAESSRCFQYLHTQGGTRRCMIQPDLHDGAHEYEAAITPIGPIAAPDTYAAAVELAETRPDPCEGCGHPSHGGTCVACEDAAQVGTYAPCAAIATVQPIAEPAPVLSAPAPASGRPTCERCGQIFRKSGSGAEWHRVNRLDCARVAVAV